MSEKSTPTRPSATKYQRVTLSEERVARMPMPTVTTSGSSQRPRANSIQTYEYADSCLRYSRFDFIVRSSPANGLSRRGSIRPSNTKGNSTSRALVLPDPFGPRSTSRPSAKQNSWSR